VPPSRLDRVTNRLTERGYDEGPEPSTEFAVSEGARLELAFRGNVRRDDRQQATPLVFHFHADVESHFQLSPVNKFLQSQLSLYRGVVNVYRVTHVDSAGVVTRALVASHHVTIPKKVCLIVVKLELYHELYYRLELYKFKFLTWWK